jgi:dethiobiotin synthetase
VFAQGTEAEHSITDITIALLSALRDHGIATAVRKPVESFDPISACSDAGRLAEAVGEPISTICAWSFPAVGPPPLAARTLGREVPSTGRLFSDTHFHPATNLAIVEACGGLATPVSSDGDNVDLIVGFDPDVIVLIVPSGPRAINAARLAARLLESWTLLLLLDGFDPANQQHVDAARFLEIDHQVFTDTAALAEQLRLLAERESRFASYFCASMNITRRSS